jgi:hypothetical protein
MQSIYYHIMRRNKSSGEYMYSKVLTLTLLLIFAAVSLCADTLAESLEALSGSAAKAYAEPMVTSFGSDMNGGWFHKAPADSAFCWDLEFGVVSMGTLFANQKKDFSVTGNFRFTQNQAEDIAGDYQGQPYYNDLVQYIMTQNFHVNIYGPTIIGPSYDENDPSSAVIAEFPDTTLTFSYQGQDTSILLTGRQVNTEVGGLLESLPFLPLVAPQLSIGTVYGTKLSFRYLSGVDITPELGKLKYVGYGIQHNPQVWIPVEIPFDVAAAFFTQSLDIGDIVETSATSVGINVSRTFGYKLISVTPYAGAAWEKSSMKFHYDYPTLSTEPDAPEYIRIRFDAEGKNTSRITAGLSFRLGLVNLNADFNLAKYPSATAGLMLNFSW